MSLGDVDDEEARDRARAAQLDIRVLRAVLAGEDSLRGGAGHYDVHVDAGADQDGRAGKRVATCAPAPRVFRSA